jgi:hypothetical protein
MNCVRSQIYNSGYYATRTMGAVRIVKYKEENCQKLEKIRYRILIPEFYVIQICKH